MHYLRIKRDGTGMHPREVIVEITTRDGVEHAPIFDHNLKDDLLPIGYPVGASGDFYLVELPNETTRGKWRIYVNKSDVVSLKEPQRVA